MLVQGVTARRGEIDEFLGGQANHWRLERMAAVDRNILRLALFELLWDKGHLPAVVIDEAVEIAKRFGSERSASSSMACSTVSCSASGRQWKDDNAQAGGPGV